MEMPSTQADPEETSSLKDLLVVNTKLLDPFQELSRLFGPRVVGEPSVIKNADRRSHLKKGLLVRIKPSWPPVVRFGLDMVRTDDGEFTFTHSKEYYNTQRSFYVALETMDPNNIMQVLANCPYHIDSLLQLSEIMMHQDNSEVGTDLLERALHAYQSAFHTSFNPAVGVFRLDYRKQENSLNVDDDPLAVLLLIDHYALLACQLDFLLKFYDQSNPRRNLDLLPNFAYSVPLALYLDAQAKSKECDSEHPEANDKLQDALIMFPGFVTRLLKHTTLGGVTNLDKSVLFGKEIHTESDSLGRLLDLYVTRTHALWTSPDVLSWLEHNIAIVLDLVEPFSSGNRVRPDPRLKEYSKKRQSLYPALPRNVLRHLVLSDLPEAPPLFPRVRRLIILMRLMHIFSFLVVHM
ncbi:unnamed protein product [Echinostoma caproni]|uniref:VPS9 domain-containing protein n=1 Tax=Echinostoma caproni TaxID=27848 RepID=A0A183AU79_9TREM|nr:unnamed protein product [Echinostoma caproni]